GRRASDQRPRRGREPEHRGAAAPDDGRDRLRGAGRRGRADAAVAGGRPPGEGDAAGADRVSVKTTLRVRSSAFRRNRTSLRRRRFVPPKGGTPNPGTGA